MISSTNVQLVPDCHNVSRVTVLLFAPVPGPQENILEPESYVAWSTVVNELAGEGYAMVSPGEYAEACSITAAEVLAKIREEGGLFALAYRAVGASGMVVPLPEKEDRIPEIQ
jgi:hypothetical protein